MEKKQKNKPWNIPAGNSSNSRHKPVISAVAAAVCIIIYLAAVVQATVRLYLNADNNKITADQEFSLIADVALAAGTHETSGVPGFMSQSFKDIVTSMLNTSSKIEALIISSPDGDFVFEKHKDYAVTWANNSAKFINRFSFSNVEYYKPLPIQNQNGIFIKAVANAFNFNDITTILKQTLIIILIGFTIAFFTMLIQLLTGKQGAGNSRTRYPGPFDPVNRFDDDSGLDSENDKPTGLYSPRSNIGWEEYIQDRLDSELHRCSSTENDLSLIIMEFADLTNDEMFKQSAEEAAAAFTSRDLLFEYGRWGIAVILPGARLEDAIAKSEKYFQTIMGKFPRGYNTGSSLFIGITSRAGRLLNASRLTLEAGEALKKAKADPDNSIIAFKSDPEKYREFIRNRS